MKVKSLHSYTASSCFYNRMFGFISLISSFSGYSFLKRWRKLRHVCRSHIIMWLWLLQNALNSVSVALFLFLVHHSLFSSVYRVRCATGPVVGQIQPHSYSLPRTALHCVSVLGGLSSREAVGLGNCCAVSGFASVCTQSCHFKCGWAVDLFICSWDN